jgi:hypothetical protein
LPTGAGERDDQETVHWLRADARDRRQARLDVAIGEMPPFRPSRAALYITVGTAKTHVARLLAKLGAIDRVQLVITAYQAGLIET